MKLFLFTVLSLLCLYSSAQELRTELVQKLESIKGWETQIITDKTDTVKDAGYVGTKPEVLAIFKTDVREDCLSPYLSFYPIGFRAYIEPKLRQFLIFRAMPYPPAPYYLLSEDYFIVGWNLEAYDTFRDCNCQALVDEFIDLLELQVIEKTPPQITRYAVNDFSIPEIRQVVQQAIDLPELQEYFKNHKGEFPELLALEELGLITSPNMKGVRKFGRNIKVMTFAEAISDKDSEYLNVLKWEMEGDTLNLVLRYWGQGLSIDYTFGKHEDEWLLMNHTITEY